MTDHIPLPPPDHTEDVPGFVHDTQRHYYSGETLRAHAERLHATRANGPAIMQAIGLLAVLQSWIGPRRPEGSEPEGRALWDQIEATRTALTPLAPAGAPTAQAAPQPAVQRGDANWLQLRSALAMAMLGWGTREDRTMDTCYAVLDAVTEPGMPLALLRATPDWRDAAHTAAPAAQGDALLSLAEKHGRVLIERCRVGGITGPLRWGIEYGYDDEIASGSTLLAAIDAARSRAKEGCAA